MKCLIFNFSEKKKMPSVTVMQLAHINVSERLLDGG